MLGIIIMIILILKWKLKNWGLKKLMNLFIVMGYNLFV